MRRAAQRPAPASHAGRRAGQRAEAGELHFNQRDGQAPTRKAKAARLVHGRHHVIAAGARLPNPQRVPRRD